MVEQFDFWSKVLYSVFILVKVIIVYHFFITNGLTSITRIAFSFWILFSLMKK